MPGATIQRPTPPTVRASEHGPRERVTSGKWAHARTLSMPVVRWMTTRTAGFCRLGPHAPSAPLPPRVRPPTVQSTPRQHAEPLLQHAHPARAHCNGNKASRPLNPHAMPPAPGPADMRSHPYVPWPAGESQVHALYSGTTSSMHTPPAPHPSLARAHARPQAPLQHPAQRCPPRRP